jgi:hypothetical protein
MSLQCYFELHFELCAQNSKAMPIIQKMSHESVTRASLISKSEVIQLVLFDVFSTNDQFDLRTSVQVFRTYPIRNSGSTGR